MKEIFAFFFFFEKDLEQLIIKNAVKTIKIKIKNNDPSNFFFFFFFLQFSTKILSFFFFSALTFFE